MGCPQRLKFKGLTLAWGGSLLIKQSKGDLSIPSKVEESGKGVR
jgi:hypothetical protein